MPPAPAKPWSFYGRRTELEQLQQVLARGRWFFMQISGRRRIGKTALIQQALRPAGITRTLYIQIPDSDPAGVVAACNGYLETFGIAERADGLAEPEAEARPTDNSAGSSARRRDWYREFSGSPGWSAGRGSPT